MATPERLDNGKKAVSAGVQKTADNSQLAEYIHNDSIVETIGDSNWIRLLQDTEGEISLRFPSAEGAHFVTYIPTQGLVAIYSGPAGPENRPAKISRDALEQLLEQADDVDIVETEETAFSDPVITGLL